MTVEGIAVTGDSLLADHRLLMIMTRGVWLVFATLTKKSHCLKSNPCVMEEITSWYQEGQLTAIYFSWNIGTEDWLTQLTNWRCSKDSKTLHRSCKNIFVDSLRRARNIMSFNVPGAPQKMDKKFQEDSRTWIQHLNWWFSMKKKYTERNCISSIHIVKRRKSIWTSLDQCGIF